MKRTTIFLHEELEADVRALAREGRRPMANVVREALNEYVARAKRTRAPRLGFVGLGASGRSDTADRHEEVLWTRLRPHGEQEAEAVSARRRTRAAGGGHARRR